MERAPSASRAALQVVGVCGQTVEVVVGQAVVSFTCLPPAAPAARQEPLPPVDPGDPAPPNTALVTEIHTEGLTPESLIGPDELELGKDPLVVLVNAGDTIAVQDFNDALASAREEGRAVRLEIT